MEFKKLFFLQLIFLLTFSARAMKSTDETLASLELGSSSEPVVSDDDFLSSPSQGSLTGKIAEKLERPGSSPFIVLPNSPLSKIPTRVHDLIEQVTSGDRQDDAVIINAFVLSKDDTIQKLITAARAGKKVTVNLAANRPENKRLVDRLIREGITVNLIEMTTESGQQRMFHCKSMIAGMAGIAGSANFSNMAYNQPELALQMSDPEIVEQMKACASEVAQGKRGPVMSLSPMRDTPKKGRYTTTFGHDIVQALTNRIQNARPRALIELTTMTLNDPQLMAAIKDASTRGVTFKIVINQSSVKANKENLRELNLLSNVQIFVFDSSQKIHGRYRPIQHSKVFRRVQLDDEGKPEYLSIITSANLTEEARRLGFDELTLIPGDPNLSQQLGQFVQKLIDQSQDLATFVQTKFGS